MWFRAVCANVCVWYVVSEYAWCLARVSPGVSMKILNPWPAGRRPPASSFAKGGPGRGGVHCSCALHARALNWARYAGHVHHPHRLSAFSAATAAALACRTGAAVAETFLAAALSLAGVCA